MPAGDDVEGVEPSLARRVHETETVIHRPEDGPGGTNNTAPGDAATSAGVATLDEFVRTLGEMELLDQAEIESFGAASAEGVIGLSRVLVKTGKLTPYQAAAIYQKKSRGLVIGNYLILDKLGQGGMGVVFKARHRRLKRVGALKILPPSFARDRDAVMRFRREVEAAGRLKHPNLVAAQDADEDRGVQFLVMDYVEGRDLDRVVRERGPMPVAQAVECLIQAARGLGAAHAQGIVHRDIKPGNLMFDAAGTVRVLDLGLARIVDAANPFSKSAAGRLTQSGTYMGTVDYMAPEQAEDSHRVDHRADIYSLGCTLYYLLTGKEPFVGETVLKRLIAHMERPAPSLRLARPEISPALEETYQKMMAKRPEERPASMAEVISLLEASKTARDVTKRIGAAPPKTKPELQVFDDHPLERTVARRSKSERVTFGLPQDPDELVVGDELRLEDLVTDVRSEAPLTPLTAGRGRVPANEQPLKRMTATSTSGRPRRRGLVFLGLGATAALAAASAGFGLLSGTSWHQDLTPRDVSRVAGHQRNDPDSTTADQLALKNDKQTIVDGQTGAASETNPAVASAKGTLAGRRSVRILSKLDERISLPFRHGAPFGEILRHINYVTDKGRNDPGIPMYVDPAGLREAAKNLTSPVAIEVRETPLKVALQQILDQLALAYIVEDDLLFISSPKGVDRERKEMMTGLAADAVPKTRKVLDELEKPISMSFRNETPLADILKYIKGTTRSKTDSGIPIYIIPEGLAEAQKTMKSTSSLVTIDLEGVPLRTTLRLLLKQLDLGYVVNEGNLKIDSSLSVHRPGGWRPREQARKRN